MSEPTQEELDQAEKIQAEEAQKEGERRALAQTAKDEAKVAEEKEVKDVVIVDDPHNEPPEPEHVGRRAQTEVRRRIQERKEKANRAVRDAKTHKESVRAKALRGRLG